jgi:cell division protein FtsZ
MMGTASATGNGAAVDAARKAISSPLLDDGGVDGARGILINITSSSQLSIHDVNEACSLIRNAANFEDVQINFGVVCNESMGEEVKITVIATGFERANLPAIERKGHSAVVNGPSVELSPDFPFTANSGKTEEGAAPEPVIITEPEPEPEPDPADIEMPAYLRRRGVYTTK